MSFVTALLYQRFLPGNNLTFQTPYQTVLLSNGSVYYGRVDKIDSRHLVLTDVFYVQGQVNQETKAVTNILIKRGKEWHRPERMILNRDHVILMEPVHPESQVAKLIEDSKKE